MNYLLFLQCRLCHAKYTLLHTDAPGKHTPSSLLSQLVGREYIHACSQGDFGAARVRGLRQERPE